VQSVGRRAELLRQREVDLHDRAIGWVRLLRKNLQESLDCENAQTVCSAGTCVLNVCGGSSANGSYDGICSSGNLNGTCVPRDPA